MGTPPVNNTPFNITKLSTLSASVKFVQATACCTTAILGVLSERDRALDAVLLHLSSGCFCEGLGVSESDIRFVWGSFRVKLVEKLGHSFALQLRIMKNRRTTSDLGILPLNLRRPSTGDERCKETLKWKWNKVPVHEEIFQEIMSVGNLVRDKRSMTSRVRMTKRHTVDGPPIFNMTTAMNDCSQLHGRQRLQNSVPVGLATYVRVRTLLDKASESPFSRAMGYRVGARECTGDTSRASKRHGGKVKERKRREINSRSRCIAQFAWPANQILLFTHWSYTPTFYTPELFAATSPFRRYHCINGNDIHETRIHALRIPKFIPTDKMSVAHSQGIN